jgi:hypothetical protein
MDPLGWVCEICAEKSRLPDRAEAGAAPKTIMNIISHGGAAGTTTTMIALKTAAYERGSPEDQQK